MNNWKRLLWDVAVIVLAVFVLFVGNSLRPEEISKEEVRLLARIVAIEVWKEQQSVLEQNGNGKPSKGPVQNVEVNVGASAAANLNDPSIYDEELIRVSYAASKLLAKYREQEKQRALHQPVLSQLP